MQLIMNRGISASGKSTWAKNQNAVRISKDDIRAELQINWNPKNERNLVIPERDRRIREALSQGYSVISDDTNFHPKHEAKLREIALEFGVEFCIKDHWVDLDEAIKRDAQRENHVGETVIRQQWQKWVRPNLPKYVNQNGENAVICDLDGTLALMTNRSPYNPKACSSDLLNEQVAEILQHYYGFCDVVLVSGRTDDSYDETVDWLYENNIQWDALYMRKTNDKRKDSVVKREIYMNEIYPKYNVKLVLDDRKQVVDMWRDLGLTVFQVADGDF